VAAAPLIGALVAALAGGITRNALPPQSIASIMFEGAAVGVIYLSAVWMFGFDSASRERYAAFARRIFDSPSAAAQAHTRLV
jgi:hypothetical protein